MKHKQHCPAWYLPEDKQPLPDGANRGVRKQISVWPAVWKPEFKHIYKGGKMSWESYRAPSTWHHYTYNSLQEPRLCRLPLRQCVRAGWGLRLQGRLSKAVYEIKREDKPSRAACRVTALLLPRTAFTDCSLWTTCQEPAETRLVKQSCSSLLPAVKEGKILSSVPFSSLTCSQIEGKNSKAANWEPVLCKGMLGSPRWKKMHLPVKRCFHPGPADHKQHGGSITWVQPKTMAASTSSPPPGSASRC